MSMLLILFYFFPFYFPLINLISFYHLSCLLIVDLSKKMLISVQCLSFQGLLFMSSSHVLKSGESDLQFFNF